MDGDYSILGLVPLRPLLNELGKRLPSAQTYLRLKQAMDTVRNEWHARADKVAQEWLKYRVGNRDENKQLMDLMHEATIAGVDPSIGFTSILTKRDQTILDTADMDTEVYRSAHTKQMRDEQRQKDYVRLQAIYNKLSPKAQALFRSVRDEYTAMRDRIEQEVAPRTQGD